MSKNKIGIIEMLICASLWSIAGIFIKILPWNGFAVASLRSLIAGITIVLYMSIMKIRFIVNKRTVFSGVLTGCVYICFTCANKLTTAANAIVLQFISPVFILVFSAVFYGKKIRKSDIITVVFTVLGITLFFFDDLRPGYLLGNIISIAAGIFMAAMYLLIGNIDSDMRFSAVTIGQLFTFIVGLPFIIFTKPEFSIMSSISIFVLGFFQLGISYILYVNASKVCPPLACCLLGAIEPLLNPVWVMLFTGEKPGIYALIGGVIVISTITLWCLFSMDQENKSERKT